MKEEKQQKNSIKIIKAIEEIIDIEQFEKLNNDEKDKYLINKKIYLEYDDSNNPTFNFSPNKKEYLFNLTKKINTKAYHINFELIDIFFDFMFKHYLNSESEIEDLKFYLEKKLDKKSRLKFLEKKYRKNLKIIESNSEYRLLFEKDYVLVFGETFFLTNELKTHVVYNEGFTQMLLLHLCGYGTMESMLLVEKWSKAIIAKNIMEFCKYELEKTNKKIPENKTKIETEKPSNYPLVFINLEKENLFKKYLKSIKAIDINNKPVKNVFQPACNAFFKNAKAMQNDKIMTSEQIFQTGRNENKFIAMLINENYLPKTTTKLSNPKNYNNIAINFIKESL
ncbi:hypothetical protein SHK09_13955 [Polaribacter sp. PL03]|uniref:hypothetical protein n=1 Tax=Polaribacter sp. PL03 TaxID=3088353 RepID=UPI0029D37452|nr:hypothetical protein [Polaribacter sp. PL03]MDX6747897.1 hypothetical protein [Polaribacter sp. PL03]